MTPDLPTNVRDRTRDWAWGAFNFGEWQEFDAIANFMREEFGYSGTTPEQYAGRFIAWAIKNRDFETKLNGKQWRWIVHPQEETQRD